MKGLFQVASILPLVIGLVAGYLISDFREISVRELQVPSSTLVDDDAVHRTNLFGIAHFNGAWVQISGEKMLNDINSVDISCWKKDNMCYVAQADFTFKTIFNNNIRYFDVTQWGEDGQITAVASTLCEDDTIKADVKTKVVTLTEATKADADKESCVQAPQPTVLRLGSIGY